VSKDHRERIVMATRTSGHSTPVGSWLRPAPWALPTG